MRGLDRRLSIYLLSLISDLVVSRLGAAARSSCPLFRVSLCSLASDICILLGFIHIQMILWHKYLYMYDARMLRMDDDSQCWGFKTDWGWRTNVTSYVETRARAIASRSLSRLSLRNGTRIANSVSERSDCAHERMHVRHQVHRSFAVPKLNHTLPRPDCSGDRGWWVWPSRERSKLLAGQL